jgi:NAD(P)-dependent dehydrogenase (short-subunit alcohol dehydrogenase family)
MDMTRLDQIFQVVERTVAHFGRLDILVNNAGIAPGNLAENVREGDYLSNASGELEGNILR